MAGTPILPEKTTIYQEDVAFNRSNSEAVMTKIAKSALYAQETVEYNAEFSYGGRYRITTVSTGEVRFVITKRSELKRFVLSVGTTGATTANTLNVKVYDEDGVFVNDLFSSSAEPSILTGSTRNNAYIGYDVDASANIEGNISGATVVYGTPNLTIFEEGYQLVGEIISNGDKAQSANLILTLQRLE